MKLLGRLQYVISWMSPKTAPLKISTNQKSPDQKQLVPKTTRDQKILLDQMCEKIGA